ncbi:MAG TPA: phosphoribosylglycinamide formyltransferase [Vicinamibacterales bacterium]
MCCCSQPRGVRRRRHEDSCRHGNAANLNPKSRRSAFTVEVDCRLARTITTDVNIGVLASHEGTTLQSVLDACAEGRIAGRVTLVMSNNSGSGALHRARQAGVSVAHLSSTTHPHPGALDLAIRNALRSAAVDLVLLAGYMKTLGPTTIEAFKGRVLNTHPALLPKFGGQGMYGDHVFAAVIEAGESESGVSIHIVDGGVDTGRVVRQCKVPVLPADSIETLKARIRMREREFVVQTLADISQGVLALDNADS